MISERRHPSIKRRLLLTLLLPLGAILVALGASGTWVIERMVESASDRVLGGSLEAISETLAMEDGFLTLDLPPSALGMLETPQRDNVYYNISYRGKIITGYPELSVIRHPIAPGVIEFFDSNFRGIPIRVAAEARMMPQLDSPHIIQVAETTKYRTALANRLLELLTAAELFLLAVIAILVFLAVDWGLRPLSVLRNEVEARNRQPEMDFAPLSVSSVPQEVMPFVSAFNAMLGHGEAAVETLRRFTSDASHQLRAPLTVVRTHVELLRRHFRGAREVEDAMLDIHNAVGALQHLIMQLISLAKAERPRDEETDLGSFDLVECTAGVAGAYAARALHEGMEVSFEPAADRIQVWGNAIFAGEMIANLLDNAVRYGGRGGHILVRIPDKSGLLEIEDDGPGIPDMDKARVFERFYRLPRNQDKDGSGLGLSIVQALAQRMGAAVSLETPGRGNGLKVVIHFRPASD